MAFRSTKLVVGFVVVGLLGMVLGSYLTGKREGTPVPLFVAAGVQSGVEYSGTGFAAVVKQAVPAVANVSSSKIVRAPEGEDMSPFFDDPFFRRFFGDDFSRQFQVPRERREKALGSAVIVSPEGYLITNNHVVEGATDITVFLSDGQELQGEIVGTDPKTDIAVLKVSESGLPALSLADSDRVEVGEFVLAIGNPFGIGQTVTFGIVSATGRGGLGIEEYEDFIQTDAAINPGNSGGALINTQGELVGINTAIIGPSGGNLGVGFAVPTNMARAVMEQIIQHGKVIRGWLGVVIQPVTAKEAQAFGLKTPGGALVGDVTPESPASKAGLERGDIILELDGERVEDVKGLRLKIAMSAPGTAIRLRVFRAGSERDIVVTLGELPSEPSERTGRSGLQPSRSALDGVRVEELTPYILRQLGLPENTRGVVVADVAPGSPASEAGLREGDVIQEVAHRAVTSVREFEAAVRQAGRQVLLLVNRGGVTSFLVVEAE